CAAELLGFFFEYFDEEASNRLALLFRIGFAFQFTDEAVGSIHEDQRQIVMFAEHLDNLLRLVLTHQAVVDENAGELVPNGFVGQKGCNGGINATGKRADDLAAADRLTDRFDRLFAVGAHRPPRLHADDTMNATLQDLGAIRRMHNFRMELHAVIFALFIGNSCKRCVRRRTDDCETIRQRRYAIAVAHPNLVTCALGPDAFEKRAVFLHIQEGPAKFTIMATFHLPAQLGADGLLAVADA